MSGLESWSKQGNSVSMATYTISHQTYESCEEVLTRLMAAYNRFKSGKGYQSLKFLHGVAGSVRALEVLHGRNGWHWHLHEIFLLQGMAKIRHKSMLATMSKRWMDVVSKSGGHAVEKGFDLKHESQSAFDYIVKFGKTGQSETWNVAREVVRAPAKQRRTEISGHHPFALLENSERRRADAVAWNEYVQATKGKQQLRYSVGAKQLLGMIDVTDDEIIDAESAAEDRVMVSIPSRGWYLLNMRATSVIVEFWQVANTGDSELLFAWLDNQDIDDVQRVA